METTVQSLHCSCRLWLGFSLNLYCLSIAIVRSQESAIQQLQKAHIKETMQHMKKNYGELLRRCQVDGRWSYVLFIISAIKHFHTILSEEWLKRMDCNLKAIRPIMESTYGKDSAVKWTVYWRTFFIAVAELFCL
ncbi:hypothetical protein Leryth_013285 [Lithospermum erythrorhizon]|nr:hypothetical protein Leryth_013285 [Lithospermum erythrorhizon]